MTHRKRALLYLKALLYVFTLVLFPIKIGNEEWGSAALCLLSLALYSLPAVLALLLHATLPPLLEGIALCFAAAANLGGEVLGLYQQIPLWDSCLHFVWGILAAVIGYALPDLLSRREGISRSLPGTVAVVYAVSFAMLTASLWEFVEYAVDFWMQTDMQKDSWVYSLHSVLLQTDGTARVHSEEIQSVVLNGRALPAYLDIGLRDTMLDMLWTFIGAIPGSALVLTGTRKKTPARLLGSLMPLPRTLDKKDGSVKK